MKLKKPITYYLLLIFITLQVIGSISVVIYWIVTGSHILNMTVMICYLLQIPFGTIGIWSLFIYNRHVLMIYAIVNVVLGLYASVICIYNGNRIETLDCRNRNAYDIQRVNYCERMELSLWSNISFISYSTLCIYLTVKYITVDLYYPVWIYPLNIKNNVTDIDKYMESLSNKSLRKKRKINI
ncbi:hypothetical protein BCR32DRAFT_297899 [Anaeromyces robustus]|uniref:Uncharacterized protein n=1 Tax=Anaeromyces robustus TaxID=1754192 RepID=A0A1Y1VUA2_9FUNG|nr:hypothetical protein BCR32DRAFT_297899 [Anaeromyces robustus]|eukprot:ORX64890.1 hypothetical protein BCR32DRAFT_297899 [Anaeromyces robustus]